MQIRKIIVGAAFVGSLLSSMPVAAQTPVFDAAGVRASCAGSGGACLTAVRAAISALKALGLTPAEVNTQLGILAGIAADASTTAPAAQRAQYAAVFSDIAAESTNPEQIESLDQLASSLGAGSSVDVEAVASSSSDS